uniref:NADH dehydrogenase subunit 2 n=1 Tax=Chaetodipus penicillatus TaxID=38672 RepID=UPI00226C9131|nr:NADH dehydrogenase subunit 2 [Chaetodipus penicillatus]UZH94554.1 NADH dehydrogenase subunit 2 [Chaetodipus penicillatus]
MNTMAYILSLITIITGTLLVLTASHWMFMWIGLEISMLAVIPLMTFPNNPRSTEAATKYFLTQATASMILMFAILNNLNSSGQWNVVQPDNNMSQYLFIMALAMKLGLAPFHFWVPEVIQGIPMLSGLLLLTWQKLAPISIMYQLAPYLDKNMIMLMALLSIILGGWGGLNQTQTRKIMAFSSIAHMGWMSAIILYNPTIMMLNLFIYIILTTTMFMSLNFLSANSTPTLSVTWNTNTLMTSIILLTLMSLGGLPPLTGFLPKWIIIQELITNQNTMVSMLMAMAALLNLYFYLRLTYASALTLFPTPNNLKFSWRLDKKKKPWIIAPLLMISCLSLPLSPLTYSLF